MPPANKGQCLSCSDLVNGVVSSAVFPGQQNAWNCMNNDGYDGFKTTDTSCFVYIQGGGYDGVSFAYCSCPSSSGRRRQLLGFEESAEVTMRKLAKAAQRYVDLTECNAMELGYRLTNVVTALLSPMFDKMGISPEYELPLTGGGSFKQPRPLEACISALLVGLNPTYFYGVHVAADMARTQISFMDVVVNNAFGPNPCAGDEFTSVQCMILQMTEIAARYRYYLPMIATRSTVLLYRDLIMSALYAMYGFDSVGGGTQKAALNVIGEGIVVLAELFQELVYFLQEPFFEAIEAAIKICMYFLVAMAKSNSAADTSKYIELGFKELFDALKEFAIDVAKGILMMLKEFPGFDDVWSFICDVVKVFVDGSKALICDEWIPIGIRVTCPLNDKSRCHNMSTFEIKLIDVPQLVIVSPPKWGEIG